MQVSFVASPDYVGGVPAIGQLVRRLREERGWTQEQLAQKVDLSPSVVARKEREEIAIKPRRHRWPARRVLHDGSVAVEALSATGFWRISGLRVSVTVCEWR